MSTQTPIPTEPKLFLRIAELRIKVKSLAAESVLIRADEKKLFERAKRHRAPEGSLLASEPHRAAWSLYEHRVTVVRVAARRAQLTLALLRGVPYAKCERKISIPFDFKDVITDASRFGPRYIGDGKDTERREVFKQRLEAWEKEAKAHLAGQGFSFDKSGNMVAPEPKPAPTEVSHV